MSVTASGGVPTGGAGEEREVVEIPLHGDAAFAGLMDALAPEPEGAEGGQAASQAGAGAATTAAGGSDSGSGGDGSAGSAPAGDAPVAGQADAGAAAAGADSGAGGGDGARPSGDAGAAAGGAEQPAATGGAGDRPAGWTASSADLTPKLGELSTKLEETTSQAYQAAALEEVRGEYGKYFDALNQHPRLMVGQEVPAIGKDGTERLRDTNDAREWQEAVKSILVAEVRDRAGRAMEENRDFLQTIHASIDLFKNNTDLVPGTKEFDTELANEFAEMAKPYELRVDGKLQGYSIPVQPIIDQIRTRLTTSRAAKTAAPASSTPSTAGAAPPAPQGTPDPPQAGITSKAGNSGEKEDFSTLFGTIGLPNLQI